MDSRDSSQSATSMGAVSRDGLSGDEDGVISVTAGLAKEAAVLFQSRKYAECLDVLYQLMQKKEDDPKVVHNIAVAEYFRDGCSDPKKLLEVLNKVKTRSEELARASAEQAEAVSNLGNKIVSGSKGSSTMANQFSAASSASLVYADEFDTSIASLNAAVIWFHLHEYKKAISILEPLYQNIGPLDETTALHTCLLLLDVALASHDAAKSADLINYLDKAFNGGSTASQGDNGSIGQQSSSLVAKSSSIPASADASISDSIGSVNASENSLSRTLSEETIDYENLLSTLDISGDNLPRAGGLSSSSDLFRTPADRTLPTTDLKLKLQLAKVQFLLLTRNLKAVKREVKEAMNMARGRDSSMALLLKSQLEYARGNHRKAIKLLMASSNRTETGISSIFNNNFGCIYYQLGKQHTSTVFFSKALSNSSSLRKDKPRKLSTFSQDKSLLIIYNCGMQYLACGKPVLAARCFQKASLVFYNQPLLWLRIAECCLMALEKGLLKPSRAPDGSEIRVNVIGKGKWRQLVLEDGVSRSRLGNSVEKDDLLSGDDKQPKLSMSLARQCLLNALHLLNSASKYVDSDLPSYSEEDKQSEAATVKNLNHKSLPGNDSKASNATAGSGQINSNGDAREQKGGTSLHELLTNSISDYEEICRRESWMIRQAVLANLAYVELELENPLKALSFATTLLKIPECSRIYIFLGHLYAGEALCLLNRPTEAAEHLFVYLSGEHKLELPYREEDCEQWRVEKVVESEEVNGNPLNPKNPSIRESQGIMFLKPEEARGTLYCNLAAMFALQGDLKQAHQFVMQALSALPNSTEAILTAVYVDLKLGKTQEALAKLKQSSHVRYLPGNLTLNNSS